MAAKGKVNASNAQVNDRIIVAVSAASGNVSISQTKTGEGVQVARVIAHTSHLERGHRKSIRVHTIVTSAGEFTAYGIETMWLAPEDAAGIKRAHVEALAEQGDRWKAGMDEIWDEALAEDAERAANAVSDAQTAQVETWLARHREAGTPRRQWSLIEDARQADHAEALTLNSQDGKVDNMNNDTANTLPVEDEDFALHLAEQGERAFQAEVTEQENATGSTVVRLLEKVWSRIREDHPELPEVVIITGSGLIGGSKWGHFRPEGWKVQDEGAAITRKDELFLAGEALAKGAAQVLQTMLHEGAHTLAKVRKVQDTSRQGRWHNAKFRKLAEEMGLQHPAADADKSHGFSFVTLTEQTKDRYADLLAELDTEIRLTCHLPAWLGGEEGDNGGERITGKPTKGTGSTSNNLKAVCRCETPRIIRVSRTVLEEAGIMCRECNSDFEAA